ncbi:hypothetical protein, partial [Burkholderia sp. SIMBA_062]|uniref:hypothetical protein n=1 Tax=Burkholderia sp. SIMBA_062 TaxID=3085803 RepID=UPI0039792EF2
NQSIPSGTAFLLGLAFTLIREEPKKLPALQKKRGRNRRPTRKGDGAIGIRAWRGSSSVLRRRLQHRHLKTGVPWVGRS